MVSYGGLFSNCCLCINQPKLQLYGHKKIICFLYVFSVLIRSQSALLPSPTPIALHKPKTNPRRGLQHSQSSETFQSCNTVSHHPHPPPPPDSAQSQTHPTLSHVLHVACLALKHTRRRITHLCSHLHGLTL